MKPETNRLNASAPLMPFIPCAKGHFGLLKSLNPGILAALLLFSSVLTAPERALSQPINPPYQKQLLRLSELIGSLHFLSLLCRPEEKQVWYEKMQEILKVEGTTTLQRAKLIERFNSGFKGFQSVYRKCSPSARTALDQYLHEGQTIINDLTTEFSG